MPTTPRQCGSHVALCADRSPQGPGRASQPHGKRKGRAVGEAAGLAVILPHRDASRHGGGCRDVSRSTLQESGATTSSWWTFPLPSTQRTNAPGGRAVAATVNTRLQQSQLSGQASPCASGAQPFEGKRLGVVEHSAGTLHTDVLFGIIKKLQQTTRPDLKIIIMSATLEADVFSAYFGKCPVLYVGPPSRADAR